MCSTILVEEHKKVSFQKNILMKLNILQKQPTWKSETNNMEAGKLKNFKTICKQN